MPNNDEHRYDDILNLPHHTSPTRPRMSAINRAAQFSPFAALTGHSEAIKETARPTDKKIEMDEYAKSVLDMKQRILTEKIDEHPEVTVTYFKPDEQKSGGEYLVITGEFKKINEYERVLILTDGKHISFDDIYDIESELFNALF